MITIKKSQKESRQTYSFETHPMNGTNQLDGTSITKVAYQKQCVNLHMHTQKDTHYETTL